MKIIYTIAGFYRAAGMERILADKANYLAGRGVGVLIVTTDQKSRPAAFPLDASVRRVDLGIDYEDNNGGRFISKLIRYPFKKYKHRRRLANLLKKERPDITISMFCGDESFLPCLPYAGKSILEVHFSRFKRLQYGRKGLWGLADRYRNRKDGNVIRRFDRFVTLTHEDAAYWGNPSNGRVIPNFLDWIPVEPSPLTRKVVLGVGRFSYQKDSAISGGSDCAWVDNIVLPGVGTLCVEDIDDPLSVETHEETLFSVFPNPTTGMLHVRCAEPIQQIVIYDLSGRQVMSFQGQAKQWNAINVNSLTNGVYFIRFLTTDNQFSVSKFIKL